MASTHRKVRKRTGRVVFEVRWCIAGKQGARRLTDAAAAEQLRREMEDHEASARAAAGERDLAEDAGRLLERFLAGLAMEECARGTRDYYEMHLQRWIDAHPGVPPLRWSRAMLDAYFAAHPTWAPRSRWMVVASLKRLRSWADGAGIYLPEVTRGLRLPRPKVKKRAPLKPEQVDALLAEARGHHYEVPIALACYAGLSLGDLRAITWPEIDLEARLLSRPGGREKTGNQLRVPILPVLDEVLRRRRPLHPEGPVCSALPAQSHETLKRIFQRAGIQVERGNGWHLLRHSFGTLLMRAGVPQRVIGLLLSHAPGSMVTALYTTPDDSDLVEAMRALEAYMASSRVAGTR